METNAYQALRKGIMTLTSDRIDRIENALVPGMPDINYCIDGTEGWIELKCPNEPKRATTKLFASNHKLSQDQMNWIKRQIDARGIVWIIVRTDHRWAIVNGKHGDFLNEMTVDQLEAHAAHSFPHPNRLHYNWIRVRQILARS